MGDSVRRMFDVLDLARNPGHRGGIGTDPVMQQTGGFHQVYALLFQEVKKLFFTRE
jgi:hypothetical protein